VPPVPVDPPNITPDALAVLVAPPVLVVPAEMVLPPVLVLSAPPALSSNVGATSSVALQATNSRAAKLVCKNQSVLEVILLELGIEGMSKPWGKYDQHAEQLAHFVR